MDAANPIGGLLERYVERVPAAFAVTRGARHELVYANAAFRQLSLRTGTVSEGDSLTGAPFGRHIPGFSEMLDDAYRTGSVARDLSIRSLDDPSLLLRCTVWPDVNERGETEHMVCELRVATEEELAAIVQRDVTERLLLTALRASDDADAAEQSRRAASFLASEGRRLAESLDEDRTLAAIAGSSLPRPGTWCIVDTLDDNQTIRRLAIVHPDPARQRFVDALRGGWVPKSGDRFGLPAMMMLPAPVPISSSAEAALGSAATDAEVLRILRELRIGELFTVPLIVRERLVGAITFVGQQSDPPFSAEELDLARDLASRSAMALDRSRLYGEAVASRARADAASKAKGAFLGMMSHELRTPLNAIGGYVDLIDMGIDGPVTDEQHTSLARIRSNQRYLTRLISDLLSMTKMESAPIEAVEIRAMDVLSASVALVEPLFAERGLSFELLECDADIVACGERERVIQILVNLLSNAIKFTSAGGNIRMGCSQSGDMVLIVVSDTGMGIPPEKQGMIFEPFIQLRVAPTGSQSGIGLGLAISRKLARAMDGDLTVESGVDQGSRFTLTLPAAHR